MKKLLSAFLALTCGHAIAADAKPNILLILIDDFGYECVTANGGETVVDANSNKTDPGAKKNKKGNASSAPAVFKWLSK